MSVNFQSYRRKPTYVLITMNDRLRLVAVICKKLDGYPLSPHNGFDCNFQKSKHGRWHMRRSVVIKSYGSGGLCDKADRSVRKDYLDHKGGVRKINDEVKFSNGNNMWERRLWTPMNNMEIYRSTYVLPIQ